MARSQFKHRVVDVAGNAIQNARCYLYETGTTTPVTDAFPSAVGGVAQASFVSNNQGEVEAWLTGPRDIKVVTTTNSGTARYPVGTPNTVLPGITLADADERYPRKRSVDLREFGALTIGAETWETAPDITGLIADAFAELGYGDHLELPRGRFVSDRIAYSLPIQFSGQGYYLTRLGPRDGTLAGDTAFLTLNLDPVYQQVGHTDGMRLMDIMIDGRGRTFDMPGIELKKQNRGVMAHVRSAHWVRQALKLNTSDRELRFDDVLLRHSGSGSTYPQLDISDSVSSDDPNNLNFTGLMSVYPHGDNFWVSPPSTSQITRNLYIIGGMFHQFTTAIGGTESNDGYTYTVTPEMRGGTAITNRGCRSLFLIGVRPHSPGYGMPTFRQDDYLDGTHAINATHVIGANPGGQIGNSLTPTFTANAASDTCTAVAHNMISGARVRLTTTTTLPAGLALTTDYFVIKVTADTFKLATSHRNAINVVAIDITDAGTGVHTATTQRHHIANERGAFDVTAVDFDGTTDNGGARQGPNADPIQIGAGVSGLTLEPGRALAINGEPVGVMTADVSLANDTLVTIDELTLKRLALSATYEFELTGFSSHAVDNNGDLQMQFLVPSGATVMWGVLGLSPSATTTSTSPNFAAVDSAARSIGTTSAAQQTWFKVFGTVVMGTTAGDLTVQMAQAVADATPVVLKAKTRIRATRIA